MRRKTSLWDRPEEAWRRWSASAEEPWDRGAVAHLYRRAGLAASWRELERGERDGMDRTVDRLLEGEDRALDGTPQTDFDRQMDAMARGPGVAGGLRGIQSAWLHRMVYTGHPLQERMTLLWHDHFATSFSKVNDAALMVRQNELLRAHALGRFGTLLREIGRDPAMLVWLDATANRKARPNENYAREVMELFTLGRGRYSEQDIREAARAFTGRFVVEGSYREVAREHDGGFKTVLGRTGRLSGDDVAEILLDQPACAEFLARKLVGLFVSEVEEPSAALLAPLAAAYRASGHDTRVAVEMVLRSRLFHARSSRRRRVKSPVELTVGTIRALERTNPTVPAGQLADACAAMGQALFAPPSVAGWDGGTAWLSTSTSLARTNAMLALTQAGSGLDLKALAARHGAASDPKGFYLALLVQDGMAPLVADRLPGDAQEVARLIAISPEYQLA